VRSWTAADAASAAGARLVRGDAATGPEQAVIDSRAVAPGDLFVGLPGERVDGGAFAAGALHAGAWGVLVAPEHVDGLPDGAGVVLEADDPLAALQSLARAWRHRLGAQVIGITGSVGKTSTKDLTRALIAPHRAVHASRGNFNTEIGLPLEVLRAPDDTEVLVLEMGMRGPGQIAELAAIAEPDVGVITALGPVHLELLGSMEAIAATKAELLDGVRVAIVPDQEPLLEPHLGRAGSVVRFGQGADVGEEALDRLELPFSSAHMRRNAMAAVAAARAVGVEPSGRVDLELSAMRGQRLELPGGVVVVDDCYNANPLSMRAALDDLATQSPPGRRIAVLGDMLELGPAERDLHREIGVHAAASGVDVLVTAGPLAREMGPAFVGALDGDTAVHASTAPPGVGAAGAGAAPQDSGRRVIAVADAAAAADAVRDLVGPGDLVLVKASRGIALEAVTQALVAG
jgi:UDP-N-acetylmuramoyl-tripeptide--D-alanyl-D-alanine ligase